MKSIKLKILLIVLMLIPIPFSCKDQCGEGLPVLPYYELLALSFRHVDTYYYQSNADPKELKINLISQDFENTLYPCDSMALYFQTPDDALKFHSQINLKNGFGFTQEAFAQCPKKQPGYMGTLEKVDKIWISSNFKFDEMHDIDYDLSGIVDILAYTPNGIERMMSLSEYNLLPEKEAPKRFYLLLKRKPTIDKTQQFVIKYNFLTEPGKPSKSFTVETPVFLVR